ncbi:substrate-binding periplasmic protein [Rhodoferax sp. UBA5149]|uniref:substrate-binding periplasmic protein n=1 Tax=Rhodoferax sp. UBA5149 TaxID=1947379 RepID=UPI0025E42DDA|nr:transporter substrate-binding domain-containing protein [Rhodoferax sp. UBA5149]
MAQLFRALGIALLMSFALGVAQAADGPDCSRPLTLALHEHGLLYSSDTGGGIDKDVADELIKRSGCKVIVSVMARARIWQVIESGALDFSLSGISNEQREAFAGFAWYFSNKYYLLARKDAGVRQLSDFEKNTRLQLGVIRSFRYSKNANEFVDRLSAENRVIYASGLDPLYELLALNRIQGMIIEPFDYSQVAGSPVRDLTMIVDTRDDPVPHGLIMSKKSLSATEQAKWRALVDDMRRDGTMLHIFGKYFSADLAATMVNF